MNERIKIILIIILALLWILLPGCAKEIYRAVDNGDVETTGLLLEKTPDALHALDKKGYTLLHRAALEGRKEMVEMLISRGAVLDEWTRDGNAATPLHLAADQGHKDVVLVLIQKGADVNRIARGDYFRWTPLAFASVKGHKEVVELLIQKGANVKAGGKSKINPLAFAVYKGHKNIVELLLANGAELGEKKRRASMLHEAVYEGHKDVAELLIAKGMNVNHRDSANKTPLHLILYWKKEKMDILRLLLDNGAEVNAVASGNSTPLHFAAYNGFARCAALLLEKGAAIDVIGDLGRTPLALAGQNGRKPVVRLLLSLHTACKNGDTAGVPVLLEKYPQLIHLVDEEGKTPLHHAVENNHIEIAALLAAGGADVNARTRYKRIELLHGVVAKILVPRFGRIKLIKDENTPLGIALENGYARMARLLEKHGAHTGPRTGTGSEKQVRDAAGTVEKQKGGPHA